MKKARIFLPMLFLSLLLPLTEAVTSRSTDTIIVNNADVIHQEVTRVDQRLEDSTSGIGAHIKLQYANILRSTSMVNLPAGMETELSLVTSHISVQYGNTIRHLPLNYPVDLVDDNTNPLISGITATTINANSATITWATDEFADSVVEYGTSPGNYTKIVSDPLVVTEHETVLDELETDVIYYYRIHSTDQSGNTSTSAEQEFKLIAPVYLPLITKP